MTAKRLHPGWLPRTVPQAEALDQMGIIIDKAIDIDVADEVD